MENAGDQAFVPGFVATLISSFSYGMQAELYLICDLYDSSWHDVGHIGVPKR